MAKAEKSEKSFGRVHSTIGRYATIPREILDDTGVSHLAVRVAAVLSSTINYGAWNADGHVDMSYPELGRRCGVGRLAVMRAVEELEKAGWIYPPESLHRGGMRFRFSTGWSDEDESNYGEWAAGGFQVKGNRLHFDDDEPYCEALELGFPTVDARDPFVRRAMRDVQTFVMKNPRHSSRLYVLAIRERVAELRKADDYYTDEGREKCSAAIRKLLKDGPRPSPKLISIADGTATQSSGS